jgi:hypothetical protein
MPQNQSFVVNIGQGLSLRLGTPTISLWKTNDRPKKPRAGTLGFNTQTNSLEYWDGSRWLAAEMDKT